jgi:hypothetical protein
MRTTSICTVDRSALPSPMPGTTNEPEGLVTPCPKHLPDDPARQRVDLVVRRRAVLPRTCQAVLGDCLLEHGQAQPLARDPEDVLHRAGEALDDGHALGTERRRECYPPGGQGLHALDERGIAIHAAALELSFALPHDPELLAAGVVVADVIPPCRQRQGRVDANDPRADGEGPGQDLVVRAERGSLRCGTVDEGRTSAAAFAAGEVDADTRRAWASGRSSSTTLGPT